MRLIVFRRPDAEAGIIEHQGPQALLDAPRELMVFERDNKAVVAYRVPEQAGAIGQMEPTSEILSRVVREATQGSRQPTAQNQSQQQGQHVASADGQGQSQADQRQAQAGQDVARSSRR